MTNNQEAYTDPFFTFYKGFWALIYFLCIYASSHLGMTAFEIWTGEPFFQVVSYEEVPAKRR